jgi:hypothetical protein
MAENEAYSHEKDVWPQFVWGRGALEKELQELIRDCSISGPNMRAILRVQRALASIDKERKKYREENSFLGKIRNFFSTPTA